MKHGDISVSLDSVGTLYNRPSRDETYLAIAEVIGFRGTCLRGKVGCIITIDNRIISSGYNGPLDAIGCTHHNCDLTQKCVKAVHAEANAISFAAKEGIKLKGATLYCKVAPCLECARLIIQSGIIRVLYHEDYKNDLGINLLEINGVKIF